MSETPRAAHSEHEAPRNTRPRQPRHARSAPRICRGERSSNQMRSVTKTRVSRRGEGRGHTLASSQPLATEGLAEGQQAAGGEGGDGTGFGGRAFRRLRK